MKKKILFVSIHTDEFGAEKSLVSLMEYLNRHDFDTKLVIPHEGKITNLLNKSHVSYIVHKFWQSTNVGHGKRLIVGSIKTALNKFEAYRLKHSLSNKDFIPDIIHTNAVGTEFGYYLSVAFGCPHVWHIREFGKLEFDMDFDLGDRYMCNLIQKSAAVIANSYAVRSYYETHYKIRKGWINVVWNGIEKSDNVVHDFSLPSFRLLMIGRISPEKGQEDAINAMESIVKRGITNICLDIYGKGVDESRISEMIKDKQLDDYIILKGYSTNIDYSKYHCGLVCSTNEAFGRVTVEYMMASIPVIGAGSGGTTEILTDETGRTYKPGDFVGLAEYIIQMNNCRQLCCEMGRKGRARAIEHFTTEIYANNIINIYSQLID